ncbi:unnamed protein product [Sphagnum jensenii]|uniref:Fungal lipase-type domain-containing protein n=1 Tax=Sphagnum jensenii TaxID=128206 RepID=A0ABP0WK42_9BRYO
MAPGHRLPPVPRGNLVAAVRRLQRWQQGTVKQMQESTFTTRVHDAGRDAADTIRETRCQQELVLPVEKSPVEQEMEGGQQDRKQGGQIAWLTDMLEPALKLYKRALPAEKGPGPGSLVDIAASILKTTSGMQKWSISDLTLGLYLLSVRHASNMAGDTFAGDPVASDHLVGDLIYYVELARGSYMKGPAGLARVSMLQQGNVVKFEDTSSVMRPGYYIAVDTRHKLVIMCIRGTHTMHDLITDLATHSEHAAILDGESVHYGSVEGARWFVQHEIATLRKCLQEHEGYELRLVGHSLGGSTASILAMMLRQTAQEDLGISPDAIKVVSVSTPPCVSKILAINSESFITTIVLQDDVIPRMNTAALVRLRNEILDTDWTLLRESEDHKGLVELVEGTLNTFSSMQDVARRYAAYVHLTSPVPEKVVGKNPTEPKQPVNDEEAELLVPGTLLFICGGQPIQRPENTGKSQGREGHVLLRGHPGTGFGPIILSGNMLTDHKCENVYYALRDVLKGLPKSGDTGRLFL